MVCMITAVLSSICFLVGYITYHAQVGEKSSGYYRLAGCGLFPDAGFARSTGFCDVAAGDCDTRSGFSSAMGPAQADRALDGSDLAVRLYHRSHRVPLSVQMVPAGRVGLV